MVITFGEIMMRLSPPDNTRFMQATSFDITFGGGEANVSVSLSQLGVKAAHATTFPDNDLGLAAKAFLAKHGVETRHIQHSGKRLGVYFFENGSAMRPGKVVYDRADSSFANLNPKDFNWDSILNGASWFHWTGITPAISQATADACLQAIQTANRLGITVSSDVNFRKNLWQYGKSVKEIMPQLVEGCDIIVCSVMDAEEIFDIKPLEIESSQISNPFVSIAQQIMQRFPRVKKIITTRRETISADNNRLTGIIYDGTEYTESQTIEITPIVDRIGGGDAFMAGFIYGSLHHYTTPDTLAFATAASALKHTIKGDVNLATLSEIESLMKGNTTGRLIR